MGFGLNKRKKVTNVLDGSDSDDDSDENNNNGDESGISSKDDANNKHNEAKKRRDAVNREIMAEQEALRKRAQKAMATEEGSGSGGNGGASTGIYDYDGVYESFHQAKGKDSTASDQPEEPKKSRYIQDLLKQSEKRNIERDAIYERKVAREQEAEDAQLDYKGKEKFVTKGTLDFLRIVIYFILLSWVGLGWVALRCVAHDQIASWTFCCFVISNIPLCFLRSVSLFGFLSLSLSLCVLIYLTSTHHHYHRHYHHHYYYHDHTAYQRKLEERKKLAAADEKQRLEDERQDVTKQTGGAAFANFYGNMTRNVAMGGATKATDTRSTTSPENELGFMDGFEPAEPRKASDKDNTTASDDANKPSSPSTDQNKETIIGDNINKKNKTKKPMIVLDPVTQRKVRETKVAQARIRYFQRHGMPIQSEEGDGSGGITTAT